MGIYHKYFTRICFSFLVPAGQKQSFEDLVSLTTPKKQNKRKKKRKKHKRKTFCFIFIKYTFVPYQTPWRICEASNITSVFFLFLLLFIATTINCQKALHTHWCIGETLLVSSFKRKEKQQLCNDQLPTS